MLDALDIAGAVITIDAIGCQSNIVEKIIAKEADYLIALKGNQGTLNEDVRGNAPRNMAIIKKTVLNLLNMLIKSISPAPAEENEEDSRLG